MGLVARKPVFRGLPTTWSAHRRRLVSAFVICLLESIIFKLASSKISIFKLVCVVEETGLSFALSETPKTGFVTTRPTSCMHLLTLSFLGATFVVCSHEISNNVIL